MSIQKDLAKVKEWAQHKAQSGSEPPWAWYQYMKLIESVNAILAGMAATTTENSLRLEERSGKLIQLKAAKSQRGTAPRHREETNVPLPM